MLTGLCGMRLSTAGVVIGWFGIVVSFVIMIIAGLLLGHADEIVDTIRHNIYSDDVDYLKSVIVFVGCFYLAIAIIKLLASVMLVIGTMQRRHLMLLPWLMNSAVYLVFSIALNFALITMQETHFFYLLRRILFSSIIIMLKLYIYYGIYSLYKHIQTTRDQTHPMTTILDAPPKYTASNYTKM